MSADDELELFPGVPAHAQGPDINVQRDCLAGPDPLLSIVGVIGQPGSRPRRVQPAVRCSQSAVRADMPKPPRQGLSGGIQFVQKDEYIGIVSRIRLDPQMQADVAGIAPCLP